MRPWVLLVLTAFLLAGCGEPGWHSKDISGSMPALEFKLPTRRGAR